MSEIEKCPYCGTKCHICNISIQHFVECNNKECDAMGPNKPTESEAIAAWNEVAGMRAKLEEMQRPPQSSMATLDELIEQNKALKATLQEAVTEAQKWFLRATDLEAHRV